MNSFKISKIFLGFRSQFVCLVGTVVVGLTSAQASDFTGVYVRGLLGFASGETQLRQYNPDTNVSQRSGVGKLVLGYSRQYERLNLGFNVFSLPTNIKSGTLQGKDFLGPWRDDFSLKGVWGIAVEPGVRISSSSLLYASVAQMRGRGSNSYSYDGGTDTGLISSSHRGVGLGFGLRHQTSERLELVIETQQYRFNRKQYWSDVPETYRPSVWMTTLGAAYRF